MKNRWAKLTIMMVMVFLILSACGGVPATGGPAAPAKPANPPGRPEEVPASVLSPVDKPTLNLTNPPPGLPYQPAQMIGFMFPDGLEAMKVAAVNNPEFRDDGLTAIGIIEVGPDAATITSGVYLVEINLTDPANEVSGKLIAFSKGAVDQDLMFSRTPLVRNPARKDSPSFPPISPIVSSTDVCFVIGVSKPYSGEVAQTSMNAGEWSRYCSLSLLSVQENFSGEFADLANSIEASVGNLNSQGYILEANIDFSKVVSEMEGHSNILACNGNNNCGADLAGAPNLLFWNQYDQALAESNGEDFPVTIGIVKIERELNTPGQERPVKPGDYWVRLWFASDESFLGASVYGVTVDGQQVNGQTIPAIPAYFLDQENPRNIAAWISGWRLCNWCKWQSNCP